VLCGKLTPSALSPHTALREQYYLLSTLHQFTMRDIAVCIKFGTEFAVCN
jgi:hypothetical protein